MGCDGSRTSRGSVGKGLKREKIELHGDAAFLELEAAGLYMDL
jgi:hypothetical protein